MCIIGIIIRDNQLLTFCSLKLKVEERFDKIILCLSKINKFLKFTIYIKK